MSSAYMNGSYTLFDSRSLATQHTMLGSIGTQSDFLSPSVLLAKTSGNLESNLENLLREINSQFGSDDQSATKILSILHRWTKVIMEVHGRDSRDLETKFRSMNEKMMQFRLKIKKATDQMQNQSTNIQQVQQIAQSPSPMQMELEKEIANLKSQLDSVNRSSGLAQLEKQNSRKELDIARQEFNDLKIKSKAAEEEIARLQNQAIAISSIKSIETTEAINGSSGKQEAINQLELSLTESRTEVGRLRAELLAAKAENDQLREAYNSLKAKVLDTQSTNEMMMVDVSSRDEEIKKLRSELRSLTSQLANTNKNIDEMSSELLARQSKLEKSASELLSIQSDLSRIKSESAIVQSKVCTMQQEMQLKDERIQYLDQELAKQLQELIDLRIIKDRQKQKEIELIQQEARLEATFAAREKAYRENHERRQTEEALAKELEACQVNDKISQLENSKQQLQHQIDKLLSKQGTEVQVLAAEREKFEGERAEFYTLRSKLTEEASALQSKRTQFETELEKATHASQARETDQKARLEQVETLIKTAADKKSQLHSELAQAESELMRLKGDIDAQKKEGQTTIDEQKTTLENVKSEIRVLQLEQVNLQQQTQVANSTQEELINLRSGLEQERQKVRQQAEKISQETDLLKQHQSNLSITEKKLFILSEALEKEKSGVETRETEIKEQEIQSKQTEERLTIQQSKLTYLEQQLATREAALNEKEVILKKALDEVSTYKAEQLKVIESAKSEASAVIEEAKNQKRKVEKAKTDLDAQQAYVKKDTDEKLTQIAQQRKLIEELQESFASQQVSLKASEVQAAEDRSKESSILKQKQVELEELIEKAKATESSSETLKLELQEKLTALSKQSEFLLIREDECKSKLQQIEETRLLVQGMQKDVWQKESFVSAKDEVIERLTSDNERLEKEINDLKIILDNASKKTVDEKAWLDQAAFETGLIATDSFEIAPADNPPTKESEEDRILTEDLKLGILGEGLVDSIEIGDPNDAVVQEPQQPLNELQLLQKKLIQCEKDRVSFKNLYETGLKIIKENESKIKQKGDDIKTLHCHLAAVNNLIHQLGKQKQSAVSALKSKIDQLQGQVDDFQQFQFSEVEKIFEEKKDQLIVEQKAIWLQEYQQQLLAANNGMYMQVLPQNYYNYHMQLPQGQNWQTQGSEINQIPSPILQEPKPSAVPEELLVLVEADSKTESSPNLVAPPTSAIKISPEPELLAVGEAKENVNKAIIAEQQDLTKSITPPEVAPTNNVSVQKKPEKARKIKKERQNNPQDEEEEEFYVPKLSQSAVLTSEITKVPASEGFSSGIILLEKATEAPKKQQTYDAADKFDSHKPLTGSSSSNFKTQSVIVISEKKDTTKLQKEKPKKGKKFEPDDEDDEIYIEKIPAPFATKAQTAPVHVPSAKKPTRKVPEEIQNSPQWVPKEVLRTVTTENLEKSRIVVLENQKLSTIKNQEKVEVKQAASSKIENMKSSKIEERNATKGEQKKPVFAEAKHAAKQPEAPKKPSTGMLFDSMTMSASMPKSLLISDIFGVKDSDEVDELLLSDRKNYSDDEWLAVDSPKKQPFEERVTPVSEINPKRLVEPFAEVVKNPLYDSGIFKPIDNAALSKSQKFEGSAQNQKGLIPLSNNLEESFEELSSQQRQSVESGTLEAPTWEAKSNTNQPSALLRDSGFEDPNDEDEWRMSGGGFDSFKPSEQHGPSKDLVPTQNNYALVADADKKSRKKKKKAKAEQEPDLAQLLANKK